MMRIADIISSIPSMLYVILITLAAGAGAGSMILGLCVAGWIDMARIVRGEIQRLKETDFAAAARMEGIPRIRILWRHLLPNAAGPILVNLIFLIPQAIFTEAFLSFPRSRAGAPCRQPGDDHTGGAQPDACVSESDGLPPCRAVCDASCPQCQWVRRWRDSSGEEKTNEHFRGKKLKCTISYRIWEKKSAR